MLDENLLIPGTAKVLFKARGVEGPIVPVEYTNAWILIDSPARSTRRGQPKVFRLRRLTMVRPLIQDGQIIGKPVYKVDACKFGEADDGIKEILETMREAEAPIFPEHLPIYFDALHTPADQLDWSLLSRDLVIALNSRQIEFSIPDTEEGKKLKNQLNQGELPFYDIDNHASNILGDELLMSLIDQLINCFILSHGDMKLMPARWLNKISDHSVYAQVDKTFVVRPGKSDKGPRVKTGPFDIGLGGVS